MRRVAVGFVVLGGLLAPHAVSAQPAAAALDAQAFSAAAPAETLLHVKTPGRFAITASSTTGTALDLVDMITGPTPPAGEPGAADGRLDALLDTGTYKIRLHPAAAAHGDIHLRVTPFAAAAPPAIAPRDAATDATLTDLQFRSFWFVTNSSDPVRLEAAGRALADFQLWRNGRDLVATSPTTRIIEPARGHPLRDIRITATLPAGTYLATAYGGPPLPWADGSTAMPFHLREGAPDTLRPGWTGGRIGPFGSELFRAAGTDDLIRLSMEGPATLSVDGEDADIDRKSRVPEAELRVAPQQADHLVEIDAPEGTPFQLRATMIGATTGIAGPGNYFVTANTTGLGGDDVPATLILARTGTHGWTVAGSNAPEIGPGSAWHHRFNLGGEVSLLFHATTGGKLAANITGVRLAVLNLTALDALAAHPPISPAAPGVWDIAAGWYALTLAPAGNSAGVADLTLGPPGVTAPLAPPAPPSPSVTFGVQSLGWTETLRVFGNTSPGSRFGLDARPTPVDLRQAPLRVSQEKDVALALPPFVDTGRLIALEYGSGPVPLTYDPGTRAARLPAADHPRLITLFRYVPPAPPFRPAPLPEASRPTLHDNVAQFFDLPENAERDFSLDVGAGGLFRVETLGRLHTTGSIGSRFVPELARAAANGTGENMLLQGFLRAGRYHVEVSAQNSGGHAGILAAPAALLTTPALLPGGSVRATVPASTGLAIPIAIAAPGRYRIDLLGLAKIFSARLEDAQGWPFAATAPCDSVTQDLVAGQYRLLVSPEATDTRAVARLTRLETPPPLTGHGPHALPFDAPQSFTWREPAGRNDPRAPDLWQFALAAPADVTLSISDGMEAFLHAPGGRIDAHLVGGQPRTAHLAPGAYSLAASSQGRNDRLDYTLDLTATQLQPGVPRKVTLPASLAFALAEDRVVSLTSFGAIPVRAVLKDGTGRVLGRFGARENDWNFAISRLLPAGAYTLDVASAAPPQRHATPANINDAGSRRRFGNDPGESDGADFIVEPPQTLQRDNGQTTDMNEAAAAEGDGGEGAGTAPTTTEVTLALPDDLPPVKLAGGTVTLAGGGVHRLVLPQPAAGQLILAGAASAAEVVVSLEQQVGAAWRSRALAQGLAPLVALPADESAGAWRLSVWPVDGGALPINVAARIETSAATQGQPIFAPAPLRGVDTHLAAAHVALPSPAVLTLSGPAGVLAGAWPGHQATPPDAGLIAPQAADLWLVAPLDGQITLAPLPPGAGLTMTLPAGARAALPAATRNLTAWIAEAPGQPGLSAGHGMGVAENATIALGTHEAATLWNALDGDVLRVTARAVPLTQAPPTRYDENAAWTLPPASAAPIGLPPGLHTLRLDLPAGTAAIAGWPAKDAVTVWSGHAATSRTLQGTWATLLLVNTTASPSPLGIAVDALATADSLRPDRAEKRFFGAAGAIDLPLDASPAQTLVVAGHASAIFVGNDGSVRRGRRFAVTGPGRVILQHGVGLVAAWLEGAGATPWPAPKPTPVTLPARLTLSGPAMDLALAPRAPALLKIRGTAPVILALNNAEPTLFPAGAADSRYLPAGPATLRIIAPQDGDLTGSLELTTAPIHAAREGLGDPVTVAPGDAALFSFTLAKPARIGLSVRAQPDDATLVLLDASGHRRAAGVAMLRDLQAGTYILCAHVPRGAPTTLIRPAIIGLAPRPNGPPPDVVSYYRELAGLTAPRDSLQ
jgi:hypothetical protein